MADAPHPGPRRTAPTSRSAEPAAADPSRSSLSERAWEEPAQLERAQPASGQGPGGAELEDIVESARRARRSFSRVRVWPPGTPDDSHPSAPPPGGLPRPGGGFDGVFRASKAGFDLAGPAEAARPPDGLAPQPLIHRRAGSAPASAEGSAGPPTPFQPPPPAPPSPPIGPRQLSEDQEHEAPHASKPPPAIQTVPQTTRQRGQPTPPQDRYQTGVEHLSQCSIQNVQARLPSPRQRPQVAHSPVTPYPAVLQALVKPDKFNLVGEVHGESDKRRALEKKVLASILKKDENNLFYKVEPVLKTDDKTYGDDRTLRAKEGLWLAHAKLQEAIVAAAPRGPEAGQAAMELREGAWVFLDRVLENLPTTVFEPKTQETIAAGITTARTKKYPNSLQKNLKYSLDTLGELLEKLQIDEKSSDNRNSNIHVSANLMKDEQGGVWKVGEAHTEALAADNYEEKREYELTQKNDFDSQYNTERIKMKLPESDEEL